MSLLQMRDRSGSVAVMVGAMIVPFMALAALIVDGSTWTTASTRLQMAADAGAQSAAQMLSNSTYKGQSASAQQTSLHTVALYEANQAAPSLFGSTISAAVSTPTATSVTVTLTAPAPTYFGGLTGTLAPTLKAVSTASLSGSGGTTSTTAACVVALGTSGSSSIPNNAGVTTADAANGGTGILIDNSAKLQAASCPVFSNVNYNSATQYSIYVANTGSISAQSVGAAGNIQVVSGGTVSTPNTANTTAIADPYASSAITGLTAPTTCSVASGTVSATTTYAAGTVFCGPITFDGLGITGRSMTFNTGVYYVLGGNLTFNRMTSYNFASAGVTFVMLPNTSTSTAAGNFLWSLQAPSASLTAMSTGTTAGFAIYQPCGSGSLGNGQITINGTGLTVSGAIYAPCSEFQAASSATIAPPLNGTLSVVSRVVHLAQGSTLSAVGTTVTTTSAATPALTQ